MKLTLTRISHQGHGLPARQHRPPGGAQAPARGVVGLNRGLGNAFRPGSLRIERLDATQAATLVRNPG